MSEQEKLLVFGAAYGTIDDAMSDFAQLQEMHVEGEVAEYDAGIVTKEESGQVILSNVDSTGRFTGAATGAVVGAVLGAVFPPSMIVMSGLGAAAGAAVAGVTKHIGRGDIKSLGELLNPGESGIIIVTSHVSDKAGATLMSKAARKKILAVEGDAEAIKDAVRMAAGQ